MLRACYGHIPRTRTCSIVQSFCYSAADMDYLWTPWRYAYVSTAGKPAACVFCEAVNSGDDERARIVFRGLHCFVILNTYPYTSGHGMVVPYAHVDELRKLPAAAAAEMMALSQRMESVLRELYHPDGINLGMNIGKAAGAGIAGHIHMHVLPRWIADANFMSVVGETRVLPESLEMTWRRVREALVRTPSPPPRIITLDDSRMLEYALLNESVGFNSGHGLMFVDGKEIGRVPLLAICQSNNDAEFTLYYCDIDWNPIGVAPHRTVEDAKRKAESIYPGSNACWEKLA
jgi:ATP adenylyltransferase